MQLVAMLNTSGEGLLVYGVLLLEFSILEFCLTLDYFNVIGVHVSICKCVEQCSAMYCVFVLFFQTPIGVNFLRELSTRLSGPTALYPFRSNSTSSFLGKS